VTQAGLIQAELPDGEERVFAHLEPQGITQAVTPDEGGCNAARSQQLNLAARCSMKHRSKKPSKGAVK
jgi:hypothetical protein